ncbi:MAG TPA: metal ABC transporter permease [Candidatus Bathyarchaeia archaeon]|jgi:zinc transport system permease protein|nr:metal ABC transporter permease [Candidatus Bathyarchaeia archaeon]
MMIILDILSLLQSGFIQRAFIISIIIAILSSVLSIFIVLKKISLIGDGLAHTAFGGVALGYYLNFIPLWVAGIIVVLGSLGITKAIRSTKISSDAAVAVFLQLGLASGIVLISVARGFGVSLESLLFGSVLLVDYSQILTAAVVAVITLGVIFVFFKEIVFVTFDETQAQAAGIRTWFFDYLISVLSGIVVIVAIPIVGILLISSLLVLPALTSTQIAKSFRQTVILSPIIGLLTVTVGLLISLIINSAPGGTIVLTGIAILAIAFAAKRTQGSMKKSE